MDAKARTTILCVDDEPNVLDGLSLHLRRRYNVLTASSGAAGLQTISRDRTVAVIISDMRMPGMDGATFLGRARHDLPDAVRILLTGQAEMTAAIAAINEGQIFRFLTKPCPPPAIVAAVDAAVEQNRLITCERVLLEQTLHGSIKALTDILALANPICFGRATRIKQLVTELANKLEIPDKWQLEVAAMLSQLGYIALPADTVEKIYFGRPLTDAEQKMVARAPGLTEQLVRNIPRLEVVAELLETASKPRKKLEPGSGEPRKQQIDLAAQALRIALDFDDLEVQGSAMSLAIGTLKARPDRYEPRVVDALTEIRSAKGPVSEVREVSLALLTVGMVFVDDVKTHGGTLLVARGFEVTAGFVERARNFQSGTVKEPLRVLLRRPT